MTYLIIARIPSVGQEPVEITALSEIAAAIHITAFIADGYVVKAWDATSRKPMILAERGSKTGNGLSSFLSPALGNSSLN